MAEKISSFAASVSLTPNRKADCEVQSEQPIIAFAAATLRTLPPAPASPNVE
jgi:hypothetical protein